MNSKYDSGKIPGSGIPIKSKDTIKKQSVPNLKNGSSLQNYKRVEALGRILNDFEFPGEKDKVLKFIKNNTAKNRVRYTWPPLQMTLFQVDL